MIIEMIYYKYYDYWWNIVMNHNMLDYPHYPLVTSQFDSEARTAERKVSKVELQKSQAWKCWRKISGGLGWHHLGV